MFETIIGNKQIKEMLEKSIRNGLTSHSYLFVGIQGIGKKALAIEFSKKILTPNQEQENLENHPDFLLIEPDGNSIKIEQIRTLQKKIQEKPILSNQKVYVIDDADSMTQEAQNCLLKTLEEPPEFAKIILIGSSESAFLPTIKSRCMILLFNPIEDNEIKQYMKENYGMNSITPNQLAMFQGSIGKAILVKDRQQEYENVENMIGNLGSKDLIEILKLSEGLYKSKEEIYEILEYINILLLNYSKTNHLYTNCIKIVENVKKRLKQNANYDMCIDELVVNMWEEVN
ncbi:MAG: hypothetical protein HFJ36_03035 [Clostridia bacterium]|nr:hypothetical protein [Clostridia bacterium]